MYIPAFVFLTKFLPPYDFGILKVISKTFDPLFITEVIFNGFLLPKFLMMMLSAMKNNNPIMEYLIKVPPTAQVSGSPNNFPTKQYIPCGIVTTYVANHK
eukprot:NODE_169_length_14535_cov_0.769881.p12 type:complete len:100 gc:universal NODE_169_length_14535_cov_0.769881:3713-4012(+)